MNKFIKTKHLLLLIVLVAAVLRFWSLGNIPASPNWDEVAWGYNAYSIGIDGRDEFGVRFPYKYIESFGDFKPPVYAYLATVPVKIFGLNEFATRFPSALFGVLTVLLTYFLVKELFPKSSRREKIALLSALFLAISLWHIMLSRAAFEANISSFFIVLGVFSFLRAVNKNMWYLLLSAFSFALSFYTFNTARVFVPMIVIFMAFMFRKKLTLNKKQLLISGLFGLVLLLPIVPFLVSPQAKLRYEEVNIFTNKETIQTANQYIENDDNAIWSKMLHNRRVLFGIDFAKHYFDNLNPSFLFIKGDGNPKFSTQDVGQMFVWDLPFLVIGGLLLFRRREGYYWLLPAWLLLGIIPAATARETPHALRIETVLPVLQIVVAYGFVNFIDQISPRVKRRTVKFIKYLLALFLIANLLFYLHSYYSHYSRESAKDWNYGYKAAFEYLKSVEGDYSQVYFSNELGRPHAYYLFYHRVDPDFFRKNSLVERDSFGFVHVKKIGKYNFMGDADPEPVGRSIYVRRWDTVPYHVPVVAEFNLPDGSPMLKAYVKD